MALNLKLRIFIIFIILCNLTILTITSASGDSADNGSNGEETATIDENGECSNPESDPAGAVWVQPYQITDGIVTSVVLKLTWTEDDGPDSEPDTFSLTFNDGLNSDKSSQGSNSQGSPGEVTVTAEADEFGLDWNVTVECTEAGNEPVGPLGRLVYVDGGNRWSLEITYTYIPASEIPSEMGGPPANIVALLNSPVFKVHLVLMISSTYLFMVTGIIAGIYLLTRFNYSFTKNSIVQKFSSTKLFMVLAILCFIMFFIAAVPIGMWVAGKAYGWALMWSGFPAIWNPADAFSITNADNTALLALVFWGLPFYFNRRSILNHPRVMKFNGAKLKFGIFGIWNRLMGGWLLRKAGSAPAPLLSDKELGIYFMLAGVFIFFMFMVQPHG